jgi:hypothetical protein
VKAFWCWLRFGHVWAEIGDLHQGKSYMWQCVHCAKTEVFEKGSGRVL